MRAAGTQEFVAPWRAVPTDNVDLAAGIVQGHSQFVEQVEQTGIEMTYLSSTMVARRREGPTDVSNRYRLGPEDLATT